MKEPRKRFPAAWLLPVVLVGITADAGKAQELAAPRPLVDRGPASASPRPTSLRLADLIHLSLERNPLLRQAGFEIQAAQGRAIQAGRYPNPTLSFVGDEIGRNGGVHTAEVSQEILTAGKQDLSRSVAERGVDQANLALLRQRYGLLTTVRQGYFEVLALQRRVQVLEVLVKLATQAYRNAEDLRKTERIADLDLLPFRIELNRLRADLEATRRERVAAWQRLAAAMGVPELPLVPLVGSLESDLPVYEFGAARDFVLRTHPEIRSAQVGIARAELILRREQAQAIPNVTVMAGYSRNFNDRENQATYQVGIPLPVFNRNRGNIVAAQAELGSAIEEVRRVGNDLTNRLAGSFGQYGAARERAERYRNDILPDADRAYRISLGAFRGGQFEYLRVIQAQRGLGEANLEYLRALADAWKAASEIAGLLQLEDWPCGGGVRTPPNHDPGLHRALH